MCGSVPNWFFFENKNPCCHTTQAKRTDEVMFLCGKGKIKPPKKIVEYPSWVTVDEDDPRVREKMIEYDAWKQYDSKGNRQTGVFTNGKFEKVAD